MPGPSAEVGIGPTCDTRLLRIDGDELQRVADATGQACPVSKVLAGAEITVDASLA